MQHKKKQLDYSLLLLVVLSGIFLSIFQYVYNRSLWLDESYLALNILDRDFIDLLRPLDYNQIAPILFLFIEKLFTIILGNGEYILRLFPLLCYWLSIYFLYRIFEILSVSKSTIILSLSLFVFNGSIIYYSNEVKQYMTDVMVLTGMYFFTLKRYKSCNVKYIILSVAGSISIFLSNVSPIILLICGIYLLINSYKSSWSSIKYLFIIAAVWVSVFGIYYLLFIHNHPTRSFMIMYWSNQGSFMPLNPFKSDFYKFIADKYYAYFSESFQFGNVGFFVLSLLFLLGSYNLIRNKKYDIFILGIAPLLVHQGLSSMKMYPFDSRLILYTIPACLILFLFGIEFIINKMKNFNVGFTKIGLVIITALITIKGFSQVPIERSEVKECLKYLDQNLEENDKIYCTPFSAYPFKYYTEISLINDSNHETYFGRYGDNKSFLRNLNQLEGRVWFVVTDFLEVSYTNFIKNHYNDYNIKLLKEYSAEGATVLLFQIDQSIEEIDPDSEKFVLKRYKSES